jgi:hypothetical protein
LVPKWNAWYKLLLMERYSVRSREVIISLKSRDQPRVN